MTTSSRECVLMGLPHRAQLRTGESRTLSRKGPPHNRPQRGQGTRAFPRGGTSPLGTTNSHQGGDLPLGSPTRECEAQCTSRPSLARTRATAQRERFAHSETRGGLGEHEGLWRREIRTCRHECKMAFRSNTVRATENDVGKKREMNLCFDFLN